jgi:transcriptional regulator with XRE-family HTH domain
MAEGHRRSGRADRVRETAVSYHPLRLEAARRVFRSDAQLAEALGVDRSQVTRWREGRTVPGSDVADRLVGLDTAVALLSGYLQPGSILKWLRGINAHLDNRRPIDLIRQGSLSDVIAAIEAMKRGAYA